MTTFDDDVLNVECADCQVMFEVSAGEKKFLESRGLSLYRRCKPCRLRRRETRESSAPPRRPTMVRYD
jgi:hypothetical protein